MEKTTKTTTKDSVDLFKPIKKISKRFHLTLFFVFVVACLAGAILFINYTIKETSVDPNYVSPITPVGLDRMTLEKLKSLHTSSQYAPTPLSLEGRSNPFGE